jgi:hypothetical protein
MKLGERKNMLIKGDIARYIYIYATGGHIKALEAFMKITIPKKNTLLQTESEFVGIVRTEIWLTCVAKSAERVIINLTLKKFV